jgi:hypothetical protein
MFRTTRLALAAWILAATPALSADPALRVELNAAETADKRCRMSFVVENKGEAVKSFRLDLVLFNTDGVIHHRMLTEMGPVRAGRTIVRTFALDGDCARVGSILVNDVACAPGTPDGCIDGLTLQSRVASIRLYK